MKSAMLHKWMFWLGIIIVVGTHLYMLVYGLPENQMMPHSVLNLVAAGLIGASCYKRD